MNVFLAPAARYSQYPPIRVRHTPDTVIDETPDVVDVGGNWMISANGQVNQLNGVDEMLAAVKGSKRTAALAGAALGFALSSPGTRVLRTALGGVVGYFAGGMIAQRLAAVAAKTTASTSASATPVPAPAVINKGNP
jgi:hypothetical protein